MAELNIDGDAVRDLSGNANLFPFGAGDYLAIFRGLFLASGFTGRRYVAKFEIVESSRADVPPGGERVVLMAITEDTLKATFAGQTLRRIVMALERHDQNDKDYKASAAQAKWLAAGEIPVDGAPLFQIRSWDRTTAKGKTVTAYSYQRVD